MPGASQLSGGSTQAAVSRDVRAVLRGVPGSDRTVVDVSGDSTRLANKFAPLSEPSGESRRGERRRRLVLVSQQEVTESDHEWDSDTDSIGGASDVEGVDVVEPTLVEDPIILEGRLRAPMRSFASLDAVNLSELFESRPQLMRSVPHVLQGGFRSAMRVAFQEILAGVEANSEARTVRGWKLLLVLPRMVLYRPPRGGTVPRKKLEGRLKQFQEGDWLSLLSQSSASSQQGQVGAVRRRRRNSDEEAARAARALSLVQLGEISAGRQALEGASLAPGNLATLGVLTDPNRRPPVPRQELSQEIRRSEPLNPFELDPLELLTCLRKARRGAAPGPSGMTSDHLFPVLESDVESDLFVQVSSLLAVGNVPKEIIEAIRLGRMTALSKPDGGVRGIVVGDILRRLVSRTIAKQISKKVEETTAPFQYGSHGRIHFHPNTISSNFDTFIQ